MNILDVIRNEFLHDLKTDHIAVDHTGTPIARATDRAAVERAAPNAAAYFSGADLAAIGVDAAETTGFVVAREPDSFQVTTAYNNFLPNTASAPEVVVAPETPVVAPEVDFVAPETVKPSDEQGQTANQLPDGQETEQPLPDTDPVEPDIEEFPASGVAAEAEDDTAN